MFLTVGMVISARRQGRGVAIVDYLLLMVLFTVLILVIGHWSPNVALRMSVAVNGFIAVFALVGFAIDSARKKKQ